MPKAPTGLALGLEAKNAPIEVILAIFQVSEVFLIIFFPLVLGVFWLFFGFHGCFGHFLCFRGILVIFRFQGYFGFFIFLFRRYFGHFQVSGIFWSFFGGVLWSFLGIWGILVILGERVFWSFYGFQRYFGNFLFQWYFSHFSRFQGYFGHFVGFVVILVIF